VYVEQTILIYPSSIHTQAHPDSAKVSWKIADPWEGYLSNRKTPTSTSGSGPPVLCFGGGRLPHRSLDVQL